MSTTSSTTYPCPFWRSGSGPTIQDVEFRLRNPAPKGGQFAVYGLTLAGRLAYVGITIQSMTQRRNGHLSAARKQGYGQGPIVDALRNMPIETVQIVRLYTFDSKREALDAETYLINLLTGLYNVKGRSENG